MIKIKLTVPEQHFILEGKTHQEAIDSFDEANLDFYDEEICSEYEKVKTPEIIVEDNLYVCPNEECEYETHWTFNDIANKGEPVCPNDDEDLVPGCDVCHKPKDEDGRCGCTSKDAHGI